MFDYTITNFLKQPDGTGHPQGVEITKNMTGDFSPQQIDLLKISDSLSNDMIGGYSCVAFLSKYKEIASDDFLQEYREQQNKTGVIFSLSVR